MNLPSSAHNAIKHQQRKCLCAYGINAAVSNPKPLNQMLNVPYWTMRTEVDLSSVSAKCGKLMTFSQTSLEKSIKKALPFRSFRTFFLSRTDRNVTT